jgi:NAD(P)-dependent dehydrogenase (short-subunit alcohol dehydrogenase family)
MPKTTKRRARPEDPRKAGPKPPYASKKQRVPGSDAAMRPLADHGEQSYVGSGKLKDRVALITGGDSGIGRAVALAFAREGADVVISYLKTEEADARQTLNLVEGAGRRGLLVAGDIGREAHCQRMVARTVKEFGRLDILVNNAAFQKIRDDISEITTEEFDRTYRTNVYAMFFLCKAAIPHMPPGGSIINTASVQAYQPSPTLLAYSSTKGAIVTFSKSLAKMVAARGLRVNVVAPGPIWTPLIPSTLPEDSFKRFGEDTLIGRAGQPAELAPVFVLLASDQASYITGMVYGVTGGSLLF